MGLFFNRKKKAEANENVKPQNHETNASMKEAISAVYENQNDVARILEVLRLLAEGVYWVPMNLSLSEEDKAQFLNASKGDSVSLKSAARLKPDFLKSPGGELFFPAFTSREETDESYRGRFSWIQISGQEIISMAKSNQSLSGVVINGFSQPFTVTRELLDIIPAGSVVQHTIEKGAVVTFERLEQSKQILKYAAAEFLKENPQVKKAFFAKMYTDGKLESYCVVVGGDIEDPQGLFKELNEILQSLNPDLPIDYVVFPSMYKQLKACGIEPFYIKR